MIGVVENMTVPFGTSTASLFLAHHHYLLETNVKQEAKEETLYRAPKAAAVPLATAATVVVASASRIHNLVAFYFFTLPSLWRYLLVDAQCLSTYTQS